MKKSKKLGLRVYMNSYINIYMLFSSYLPLFSLFYFCSGANIREHCLSPGLAAIALTSDPSRQPPPPQSTSREVELNTFDLGRATGATQWRPGPSITLEVTGFIPVLQCFRCLAVWWLALLLPLDYCLSSWNHNWRNVNFINRSRKQLEVPVCLFVLFVTIDKNRQRSYSYRSHVRKSVIWSLRLRGMMSKNLDSLALSLSWYNSLLLWPYSFLYRSHRGCRTMFIF